MEHEEKEINPFKRENKSGLKKKKVIVNIILRKGNQSVALWREKVKVH